MNSRGIIFYMQGLAPAPFLISALYSLNETNPHIPIHVVFGPGDDTLEGSIKRLNNCTTKKMDLPTAVKDDKSTYWNNKPLIIKESPFETTLYFDCDVIFYKLIPDKCWDNIKQLKLSTSSYASLSQDKENRLIRWMEEHSNVKLKRFKPVNGGCIGIYDADDLIETWIKRTQILSKANNARVRKLAEEYALATILNENEQGWLNEKLNMPYSKRTQVDIKDAISVHFANEGWNHINKKRVDNLWFKEFEKAESANFLGLKDNFNQYTASIQDFIKKARQ